MSLKTVTNLSESKEKVPASVSALNRGIQSINSSQVNTMSHQHKHPCPKYGEPLKGHQGYLGGIGYCSFLVCFDCEYSERTH